MQGLEVEVPPRPVTTETPTLARRPSVVVRPSSGWSALNLRELWEYRDLLFILAGWDVKLRYKQTALGVIWVVLQPLVAALIFAVIFGRFARLPSGGTPYFLFVFCGLLPWNLLAGIQQRASNSLIGDSRLISKVYFPRGRAHRRLPLDAAGVQHSHACNGDRDCVPLRAGIYRRCIHLPARRAAIRGCGVA